MRTHGTRKLRQKPCSHTKQKHKNMASKQTPAMCKTRHEHAANENIHKPRVHTRHDNMKARSQWNTQAACHTAQDITWIHAADKNKKCVQHHKTHMDRRARWPSELETTHSHNETEHGAWVSEPWHETETQDMSARIRTPRSNMKQGTQTREHEHTRSRALTWNPDMTGVSGLCHKTMNNTRPKWQNPDTFPYYICLSICHPSRPIHPFNLLCTASVFLNTINGVMWLPLLVHCH